MRKPREGPASAPKATRHRRPARVRTWGLRDATNSRLEAPPLLSRPTPGSSALRSAEKRARRRGEGIRLARCRLAGWASAEEGGHRLVVHVISPQDALSALLSVGGALGTGLCWDVDRHVARCGGLGVAPWHESRREEIGRCREVDAPMPRFSGASRGFRTPCARNYMERAARGQLVCPWTVCGGRGCARARVRVRACEANAWRGGPRKHRSAIHRPLA